MNNLLGAVLCGGQSSRMGTDKGLMKYGTITRAEMVASKLITEGIEVIYSINKAQFDAYAALIDPSSLVIDCNDLPGPLKGLMSVHSSNKTKNILLIACDMLDITSMDIRRLVDAYELGGYDHYAFGNDYYYQPFCAIYSSGSLSAISTASLPGLSLQRILQEGKTCRLSITSEHSFSNYNTP